MASDVKAIRVTTTGLINVGPARIRAMHVSTGTAAGRLTITNGVGGPVVFDANFDAADTTYISVPDQGIRCENGMVISTITNITSITMFYN